MRLWNWLDGVRITLLKVRFGGPSGKFFTWGYRQKPKPNPANSVILPLEELYSNTIREGMAIKKIKQEDLPPEERYNDLIRAAATHYRIPYHLLHAQVWQESRFHPDAVSRAGAQGLLQIMPRTARGLGLLEPFNPERNLFAGARYLRAQYDRYKTVKGLDRWRMALASYNCGAGYVIVSRRMCKERTDLHANKWPHVAAMLTKAKHRGKRPYWPEPVLYVQLIVDRFHDNVLGHLAIGQKMKMESFE